MGNCCECSLPPLLKKKRPKRLQRIKKLTVLDQIRQQRKLSLKIMKLFDMNTLEESKIENTARDTVVSFLQDGKQFIQYSPKTFAECYEVVEQIGFGTQAVVDEVMHRETGDLKVAKRIKVESIEDQMRVENEIIILQEIDHPNILKVYEYFLEDNYTILITDYVKGGSLYDAVKEQGIQFTEQAIASIMHQLFSGLRYLHSKSIIHCDIKPENILFEEVDEKFFIKLIDFGIVRDLLNSGQTQLSGTPGYMSPEHRAGDPVIQSDLWAAGVVCYFLFTGKHPFEDQAGNEKKLEFPEEHFQEVSIEATDLISTLLDDSPWKRPTIEDIFENKWMKEAKRATNEWALENAADVSFANIEDFAKQNKLIQAIAFYLASKGEGEDHMARAIFDMADKENRGSVSYSELVEAFKQAGRSEKEAEAATAKVFDVIDSNQNGVIDYTEFVAANYDLQELEEETRLKTCFDSLDKEGSGTIEIEDLVGFVYPEQPTGDEERKQIEQLLPQGEQKEEISFSEFKTMVENSFHSEEVSFNMSE